MMTEAESLRIPMRTVTRYYFAVNHRVCDGMNRARDDKKLNTAKNPMVPTN